VLGARTKRAGQYVYLLVALYAGTIMQRRMSLPTRSKVALGMVLTLALVAAAARDAVTTYWMCCRVLVAGLSSPAA
jgi:hypothetical protein